jgi:DNA topoisomerase-1
MMTTNLESRCILCMRKAVERQYCEYHYEALQSLKGHYEAWRKCYGEISWIEYLNRLQKISHTGKWVKQVIEIELKNEQKKR